MQNAQGLGGVSNPRGSNVEVANWIGEMEATAGAKDRKFSNIKPLALLPSKRFHDVSPKFYRAKVEDTPKKS